MNVVRGEWGQPFLGRTFASDAMTVAARKRIGAPPEWEAFEWSVMDPKNRLCSDVLVRGAVPIGVTKTGRTKWPRRSSCDSVVIHDSDVEAAKQEYERQTGKCADCIDGHEYSGFSVDRGYKYRACSRCEGSGKPREVEAAKALLESCGFTVKRRRSARAPEGAE